MSHKKPAFANTAQPADAAGLARACLSGRRVFASGHSAGPYGLRCFAGSRMHEGLSAARRFAVRSSWMSRGCLPQGLSRYGSRERRGRGAVCCKAFHVAESAVTGAACFCKRLGAGERVPHGVESDGSARFWGQETVLSARVSQDGVPILDAAKRRRCA